MSRLLCRRLVCTVFWTPLFQGVPRTEKCPRHYVEMFGVLDLVGVPM